MITIIVAHDKHHLIGSSAGYKGMPWHNKEELSFFKQVTQNHAVVMGRKTFEKIGKPLVNRCNYVLTKSKEHFNGVTTIQSPYELLPLFKDTKETLFVIGGKSVYELFFPFCQSIVISLVHGEYEGDVYFHYELDDFELIETTAYHTFTVYRYRRRET